VVSGQPPSSGNLLFEQVNHLVDAAMAVNLRVDDRPGSLALASSFAPIVLDLLTQGGVLLDSVSDHYRSIDGDAMAGEPKPSAPVSLEDIGALISTEIAVREILDLMFIAKGQLRGCIERLLTANRDQNLVAMVTSSDSALNRLRRAFFPLQAAIADFEGLPPPSRAWGDLEISLQTRQMFGRLRRAAAAVGSVVPSSLAEVLTDFAHRLAEVRSGPLYHFLRVNDRIQMLAIGRRIAAWLCADSPDPEVGRRLWSDLTTFLSLLVGVNYRHELVEYDRQVISRAYSVLYAGASPPSVIPDDLLEGLHSLAGREAQLDQLIESGTRRPGDWKPAICRAWYAMEHSDFRAGCRPRGGGSAVSPDS